MPKVKNPLLSMEARGGIGGLVYNTWRGINYVKTNTSPTGQGTALRLAAQALMSVMAKRWKGISQAQRNAWGVYATDHPVTDWTGAPKRLTGMNWFCRCNITANRAEPNTINDPPAVAAPDPITGLAFTKPDDYLELKWTTPTAAPDRVDIWMVGPISAGIAPKIERAKFLMIAMAESGPGVIVVNAPASGRWTIFARVLNYSTGLTSTWLSKYIDVA